MHLFLPHRGKKKRTKILNDIEYFLLKVSSRETIQVSMHLILDLCVLPLKHCIKIDEYRVGKSITLIPLKGQGIEKLFRRSSIEKEFYCSKLELPSRIFSDSGIVLYIYIVRCSYHSI